MTHHGEEGTLGFVGSFGSGAGGLCLFKEAHILDGEYCLAGERLQKSNLFVCERYRFTFADTNTADGFSLEHHRDNKGALYRLCFYVTPCDFRYIWIILHIGDMNNRAI